MEQGIERKQNRSLNRNQARYRVASITLSTDRLAVAWDGSMILRARRNGSDSGHRHQGIWNRRGQVMKAVRYSINVLATGALGVLLARWFVRLPIETSIPSTIESVMALFGVDTIAHADDVEGVGLLLVLGVCLGIAGLIVWGVNRLIQRSTLHG
ncbi:hypothetical protein [Burkholderia sp. Bp8986]|uniref:hypothetical protein n=1 Tax=Burkholderia sp. Bp8986 TaxID=2184550 RepID=UPI000F5B7352|nr:hypothetical protein [Burkholderia sp. Bp8986]